MVKTKYLLQAADGRFLGSPAQLTDNINLAAVFDMADTDPLELATAYGPRHQVKFTPMQMIPIGTGIFPKYDLKPLTRQAAA